jgi:hypothetical protein
MGTQHAQVPSPPLMHFGHIWMPPSRMLGSRTYRAGPGDGVPEDDAGDDHGEHLADGHDDREHHRPELLDGVEDEQLAHGLRWVADGGQPKGGVRATTV